MNKVKKVVSILIFIVFLFNITILSFPTISHAAEIPDIDSLPVKEIAGFHVVGKKIIRNAASMNAWQAWDGYQWYHTRYSDINYYNEYKQLQADGWDDQTPQNGSNEELGSRQEFGVPTVEEGTPYPEYGAYWAEYWAFMVLYAPDVPQNGKVTVKYIDVDSSIPIANSDVYNNVTPGTHSYNFKTISGYNLAPGEDATKNITVEAGKEYTVTFKYKQIPLEGVASVVVRYLDESDNDIKSADTYTYKKSEFGVKSFTAPQTISTYNINGSKTQSVDVKEEKIYTISFKYKKSLAPTVTLNAPSIVTLGDDVSLYARGSTEDSTVKSMGGYIYIDGGSGIEGSNPIDAEEKEGTSINISGTVYFTQLKTYYVQAFAYDSNGRTAQSEVKAIKVVAPEPSVKINKSGTEKENRKIVIDVSDSYSGSQRASIKWDKVIWKFEGVEGSNPNDIRVQTHTIGSTNGTILIDSSRGVSGSFANIKTIDILYKKAGKYKVTCTLENSYGGIDTKNIILNIVEDLPPIGDCTFPKTNYRDPNDLTPNGYPQSTIEIVDQSYSPDGDIIVKRGLIIADDTDNNSINTNDIEEIYSNENWYIYDMDYNGTEPVKSSINPNYIEYSVNPHLRLIGTQKDVERIDIIDNVNTGNNTTWLIKSTHVGHSYILVVAKEEFSQDTIPQFVTIADRKVSVFYE